MKKHLLTKQDRKLVKKARDVAINGYTRNDKILSDVSCCLITSKGELFSGVDIEGFAPGSSICAETSALSNMIKNGNGKENVSTIVALYDYRPKHKKDDYKILPPCGTCRDNISLFGNPWVIISKTSKVKLRDLYPLPFKG